MRIDHTTIWTYNLEGLRSFYLHYFDASSTEKYYNHSKGFSSYFLTFDGMCRLEIMEMPGISVTKNDSVKQFSGLIHFAIKIGSRTEVDKLTEQIRNDGFRVVRKPSIIADDYYE